MRIRPVRLSSTPPKPTPIARTFPPNSASRAISGGIRRSSQSRTSVAPLGSGTFSETVHSRSPVGVAERELLLRGADFHAEIQVLRNLSWMITFIRW